MGLLLSPCHKSRTLSAKRRTNRETTMTYSEAKEHTPGRLHELFADPYRAFENDTEERQLHIRVMLHTLLARPMQRGLVTLRVIHGWENGGFEPADLQHADFTLHNLQDFEAAATSF